MPRRRILAVLTFQAPAGQDPDTTETPGAFFGWLELVELITVPGALIVWQTPALRRVAGSPPTRRQVRNLLVCAPLPGEDPNTSQLPGNFLAWLEIVDGPNGFQLPTLRIKGNVLAGFDT